MRGKREFRAMDVRVTDERWVEEDGELLRWLRRRGGGVLEGLMLGQWFEGEEEGGVGIEAFNCQ